MSGQPIAHPALAGQLADIRRQVAGLLGDIDTMVKPQPDEIVTGKHLPGPVWRPVEGWTIRVVDPDEDPASACVFVNHPYTFDDDLRALTPADARRVGMAYLAAADRADKVRDRHTAGELAKTTTAAGGGS